MVLFKREGATSISVYLPGSQYWYDIKTRAVHTGGNHYKLDVSDESLPAFQKGGTIIPRKDISSSTTEIDDYHCLRNFLKSRDRLKLYDSGHRFEHIQFLLVLLRAIQNILFLTCSHPENRTLNSMPETPK